MESKNLVVKSNSLINASYNLSLIEQRLILLAIVELRTGVHRDGNYDYLAFDKPVTIKVQNYAEMFDCKADNSIYDHIKTATNKLFERQISFEDIREGKKVLVKTRWVSHVIYLQHNASVEIVFTPIVRPLLTFLKDKLTSYQLEKVSQFTSVYAIRLYELVMAWKSVKKTPVFKIQDFRKKLGVDDDLYPRMSNFKARVLTVAVKQINKYSDITIEVEQHKKGREVEGFSFSFKYKKLQSETNKKTLKRPKFPAISNYKYAKLDKQNPKMSSADYAVYANECLSILDSYYNDIASITIEDLRYYYIFLAVNLSHKSKLFEGKNAVYEEIQKRGYKLVNCELKEL